MTLNQPTSLNCPACGAPLDVDGTSAVVRCQFCGNVSLLPGILASQTAAPASALDEIRLLAGGGNLADAIERYRQTYGVDLQEASDAIDALQAGRLATPSAPGMRAPEELTKALEDVQRMLSAGDKIGAIKVYREHYDVSMERAKYAIEQITAGQTLRPETGFQTLTRTMPASQPSRSGRWIGGIIVAIVLLFIAGLISLILFMPGGPLNAHYSPNGPVAIVPSEQGSSLNIVAGLYNPDKDTRFIGLVDGTTGKLLWHAASLSGDGNADAVTSGPDLIYAANTTDLLAYRKSDGSQAWQVQMPDKLNYGATPILVTAGRVITINADQSIQAYDAETGSLVWSKRLLAYDRTLRLMGNYLVVMDYTDNNYNYGLIFFDPATGSQQRVLTPTCTYNDYSSNLDTDAGLIYDQAGNALYLVYDSSYGCVQRLDLASGQTVWEADSKDSFSFSLDDFQSLLTDSTLYFSNGNDLLAVDKSTGTMKVLLTNPDYDILPLAVAGDKLIVRARRTRGTEHFELWGVDAASGRQSWQLDMQGSSPIDPPNEMIGLIDDTGSGWTWKLVPAGLVVMRFQAKPNQLVLETFNPANGTSLGKQAIVLKRISGDFYDIPTVIGWQGNVVYLNLELDIYSLDVTTGELKVIY
jgi:outer membrane protein assembly factor BamB/ribosomal protein L7/L12